MKAEPVVDEYNMNMSIYMLVDVISSETGAIQREQIKYRGPSALNHSLLEPGRSKVFHKER